MRGLLLLPAAALACLPLSAQLVLDRNTTLVVSSSEPESLRKAAADLAADLERVFGAPPPRAESAPPGRAAIVVALRHNLPAGLRPPDGFETPLLQASGSHLVLTGSDPRGAIYAVYEFSHRHLGVDPFHWWTDHEPAKKERISIPSSYHLSPGSPTFRYRGWFINDEDLLTGWRPATPGSTQIAPEVWDRIFEALLRLRGNMIVPGTFIFPDEPQVRAAGRRGLIISQHHIEVLGTNTWRWPDAQPYSFAQFPQILVNAWRNSLRAYDRDQEVIWTVGYRGRHDRPFWEDDSSIPPTPQARAQAIGAAIDRQMQLVRAERPNPRFIMNAWMEAVPLIQQGLLTLPEGVTLVWPDNGHGLIRDAGKIARGQGVYYHTAMHDFVANQLTEMVPPERIGRELGRAARAGAAEYLLVNVSDVRPYPLSTRAAMDLAAGESLDNYLEKWSGEEFGPRAAPAVAAYYRAYFEAPGRLGPAEHETLADTAYHNYLRFILVALLKGRPELSTRFIEIADWDAFIARVTRAAREAQPRWEAARVLAGKAAPLIPPDRKAFFQSHILTQLDIHERSNRALLLAAEAWTVRPAAPAKIAAAVAEIEAVLAAMHAAEYGKWKGFYSEDRFTNVRYSLTLAQACQAKLAGKELPRALRIEALPPDPYHWLKSYQAERWVDVRRP
ncbi:MAG: glycosyl hydrolase 115 family protein [Acidobacteria bacterium]|nr:glycosyl hydrolase 115 family protein [Acidobacteriota bacterium]